IGLSVDPEVLGEPAVRALRAGEVDQGPQRELGVAGREQPGRGVHHVARPDEVVPTAILVALRLAPRNAARGDRRTRIGLVLVREQQPMARLMEAPAVATRSREGCDPMAGAAPLLDETFAVLRVGEAQRLNQVRRRAVQAVAEAQAERELEPTTQVELSRERDVAVLRDIELPVHAEVAVEVGPAVRGSDVAAGAAHEGNRGSERKPDAVLV